MRSHVDHQIVQLLAYDPAQILKNPLLSDPDNRIHFGWPSLLEYLGLGSVLSSLPAFDETKPLFAACVSTMYVNEEKEVLHHVYDRLFAENLNQVRTLPQIKASFLLQAIREQREKPSFGKVEKVVSPALAVVEAALIENESHAMHDLILYLAWDRMCVCMARLFNYQSTNPKFIQGISVFKECLIESYQHIVEQGRTSPGIYRMIEALFFYHMREENLQKHTAAEWAVLSQSFHVLKAQDELVDFSYIDDAVMQEEESSELYLTLDSPEIVGRRLALAQCIMDKIKAEIPELEYELQPKKIVYLTL
jgi:hypothetical protein